MLSRRARSARMAGSIEYCGLSVVVRLAVGHVAFVCAGNNVNDSVPAGRPRGEEQQGWVIRSAHY